MEEFLLLEILKGSLWLPHFDLENIKGPIWDP